MFTATFLFLGIAGFIVAASACLSAADQAAAIDVAATWSEEERPTWDQKAKWQEIKAAWLEWYSRCQAMTIVKQKETCSWARTLALCAALCLIGVFLEATFDQLISISHIINGFRQSHPAATSFQRLPSAKHSSR